MAEISQIRLPNNTVLDLKDIISRKGSIGYVISASTMYAPTTTGSTVDSFLVYNNSTKTLSLPFTIYNINQPLTTNSATGIYIFNTRSYDGWNTDENTNRVLKPGTYICDYNDNILNFYCLDSSFPKYVIDQLKNIPAPESMSNVQAMLTELGLDPNASLTPATVPAETNRALVQEG